MSRHEKTSDLANQDHRKKLSDCRNVRGKSRILFVCGNQFIQVIGCEGICYTFPQTVEGYLAKSFNINYNKHFSSIYSMCSFITYLMVGSTVHSDI